MARTLISEGIIKQAQLHPDKPAVIGLDENGINYTDVVEVYRELRTFLSGVPVESTDRLALLTGDGIIYSILALSVMEHGALVPLDPELNKEKSAFFFDLLNVDYIITDYKSQVLKIADETDLGIIMFNCSGGIGNLTCNFELLRKPIKKSRKTADLSADIAVINTTSGTTSTPKIVPKTYRMIYSSMQRNIKEFDHDDSDIFTITARMYQTHSYNKVILTLFTGGTAIVTNGFRHKELIDLINENRTTCFITSPAVLNSLAHYLEESKIIVTGSSLRFILSSGAPLTEKLRNYYETIFAVPVVQSYGMTETGNITSTYKLPRGYKEGSAGISTGLEIKILNGEILIRGNSVFPGYENPEEPNDNYFIDGWFRTGDEGYLDEDGYLFITGRFKEMINRGGGKVSPYEVEAAILQHAAVNDAAVFPIPNSYGSEDVGAAVVLTEGQQISIIELREFLQGRLSPYRMPMQLYMVKNIPAGKNGKVQRRLLNDELQKLYPDQIISGAIGTGNNDDRSNEDLSATEQLLLEIWQKALNRKTINIDDDFFVLGGDSLRMALVFSELEGLLGIQVPINVLFHRTTIRELAAYIDSRDMVKSGFKFLVPIKEAGYKSPLFCIHALDGEAMTYHSLGEFIEEDRPIYGLRFVPEGTEWQHPITVEQLSTEYAREIQALDPHGPYNLCGTCIGGVLSYAVAQVLIRNGKQVAMLAMLDSIFPKGAPGKQRIIPLFINSMDELKSYRMNQLAPVIGKKVRSMVSVLLRPFRTQRYINATTGNKGAMSLGIPKDVMLSWACHNYKPEFFNGTVYYFSALRDRAKQANYQNQWAGLVKQFCLIEMGCRHNDINSPENSRVLMERFKAIMERLDA